MGAILYLKTLETINKWSRWRTRIYYFNTSTL